MATDSKHPSAKPFTPSLSSKFRGTKSPLTPRLAGSAPQSPASAPRRDAIVRSAPPPRAKEATAAPVTATTPPLNGNITPRSGARRSRIGSESPATPASATRTQPKSPPKTIAPAAGLGISNLSVSSPQGRTNHMANSVRPPPPTRTVPRRLSGPRSTAQNDESIGSKFIRAEAARSSTRTLGSGDKISVPVNDGKFFTASTPQSQSVTAPKPSLPRPTPNSRDSKFFHASDIRAQSSPRSSTNPGVHCRGPGASPILSRLQSIEKSQPALSVAKTTVSPTKPAHQLLKTTPNLAPAIPHPPLTSPLTQPSTATSLNPTRRPSIASNVSSHKLGSTLGHTKALSTSSLTDPSNRRASISRNEQPVFVGHESPEKPPCISLSPNTVSSRSVSLASSSFATSIASEIDRLEAHTFSESTVPDGAIASILAPPFEPSTPASSEPPNVQNDVAATARRERKVLDLEISNSSLLAINKTLERELRKQTVELRRFRRLTRSGRLSIAPADRTVSNSTLDTVPELFDEDHSDSEQDDDDDASDLDEDDSLSTNSSDPLSPTFKASQRARDEKRLLHNLSKHQQMLVDSQKLAQSIRRCLTCTEELIRDANKAIDYRVGIGDVKLGGRVLSTDELESQSAEADQEEYCSCLHNQGLLGPGIDTTTKAELTKANLQIENATTTGTAEPQKDEDNILAAAVERLFQDLLHGPDIHIQTQQW